MVTWGSSPINSHGVTPVTPSFYLQGQPSQATTCSPLSWGPPARCRFTWAVLGQNKGFAHFYYLGKTHLWGEHPFF